MVLVVWAFSFYSRNANEKQNLENLSRSIIEFSSGIQAETFFASFQAALFAECKWRNEKVDLDILETLIGRSKLFRYTKVHYYLFSKSGFTKGCMEKAEEMGNVTLVSYADIIGAMRK